MKCSIAVMSCHVLTLGHSLGIVLVQVPQKAEPVVKARMLMPGELAQGIQSKGDHGREAGRTEQKVHVSRLAVALQPVTAACGAQGTSLQRPQGPPGASPLHPAILPPRSQGLLPALLHRLSKAEPLRLWPRARAS